MKKGFVFIETIIVITILTVGLISLYANYSKILSNTKEFNTFDTAEYNYKTYNLKRKYIDEQLKDYKSVEINDKNKCYIVNSIYSDTNIAAESTSKQVKVCLLESVSSNDYIQDNKNQLDAYIIDYLNNKDWNTNNDNIFLVEYKKKDKQTNEYFTYISSLNY